MANPEHVRIVKQGAEAVRRWRIEHPNEKLDLSGADFEEDWLGPVDLSSADLSGANFKRAVLNGANLASVNAVKATFWDASLGCASLTGAYFDDARLPNAKLTNTELTRAHFKGANLREARLTLAHGESVNFNDADLSYAKLNRVHLKDSKFIGSRLWAVQLNAAYLDKVDLTEADLGGAYLADATLKEVRMTSTGLTGAVFSSARFIKPHLEGINLGGVVLGNTVFVDCDLSQVVDVEHALHVGPSSIGVDTLSTSFRKAGNRLTPELRAFFLGAGVPKELIDDIPQIMSEAKYFSCFVSYGEPDKTFAERLVKDLRSRGVSCWIYSLDYTPGKRTWPEIRHNRQLADRMVVICSFESLTREGVLKELEEQIDEDPGKLIPISRDKLWTNKGFRVIGPTRELTHYLRDVNYADFSEDTRYEESLERLLKALKRKRA